MLRGHRRGSARRCRQSHRRTGQRPVRCVQGV